MASIVSGRPPAIPGSFGPPTKCDSPRGDLLIRIVWMNNEFECAAVPQPHGREVPDISRRETTDTEVFCKHHDRRVNQAEAKVAVSPVYFHGSRELIDRRRRIRERPAREIVHESVHCWPLAAKEVVDFR